MLQVLRESMSSVSPQNSSSFVNSSHMSVLSLAHGAPGCHWFTATPDPTKSLFKPFIFSDLAFLGLKTASATSENDESVCFPRYLKIIKKRSFLVALFGYIFWLYFYTAFLRARFVTKFVMFFMF